MIFENWSTVKQMWSVGNPICRLHRYYFSVSPRFCIFKLFSRAFSIFGRLFLRLLWFIYKFVIKFSAFFYVLQKILRPSRIHCIYCMSSPNLPKFLRMAKTCVLVQCKSNRRSQQEYHICCMDNPFNFPAEEIWANQNCIFLEKTNLIKERVCEKKSISGCNSSF